jgi:hypothetical protein
MSVCAKLPANETIALHFVGTFRYSGGTTMEEQTATAARSHVQSQAILAKRMLKIVGRIRVTTLRT